jgi:hypothetical protein
MVNPKTLIEKWVALPSHKQVATFVVVPIFAYFFYCSVIVIAQPFFPSQETRHHGS